MICWVSVPRDGEGLRMVLQEMQERAYDLRRAEAKLESGAAAEMVERMRAEVAAVTLSPGYQRWATHLMLLERQHKLGLLGAAGLLAVEVDGLLILEQARAAHRYKHPECGSCGMAQENRFQTQCVDCGTKFVRRGR